MGDKDLYASTWLDASINKEAVNIEDIRADAVLSKKAEAWMKCLVDREYESKEEWNSAFIAACHTHQVRPKNRLDINLIYWRLLGEKVLTRNKNFEKYSVQEMPDVEDTGSKPESEEEKAGRLKLEAFVSELVEEKEFSDKKTLDKAMRRKRKKYHIGPSKLAMQKAYQRLCKTGAITPDKLFENLSIKKGVRSESGVLVVTVLTSPYPEGSDGKTGRFDCTYDCAYCPSEPGMPRSYISTEPAVRRAIQNNWEPIEQFNDRVSMLAECGHTVDKIEILVLGGTWSSYPLEYREGFVRDLFYAANTKTFLPPAQREDRPKLSLREERKMNESAEHKIIGVTLETRPDCINKREIRHLRECGCTRTQLGIQHTADDVLKKINRACTRKHNVRGIRMLKEAGFKVDIHLMPDLPGSSVDKDMEMFRDVLYSPDMQADQWKIYPTSVVRHSAIEKWYEEGTYVPYADTDHGMPLLEVVMQAKAMVHPWIRLNRVIRDIPAISILGGNDDTNMRQKVAGIMKDRGIKCDCIRCREVRDRATPADIEVAELVVRQYQASEGTEYFISFESPIKEPMAPLTPPPPEPPLSLVQAGVLCAILLALVFAGTLGHVLGGVLAVALLALPLLPLLTSSLSKLMVKETTKDADEVEGEATGLLRHHPDRPIIYAFLRLRINGDSSVNIFDELKNSSLIRELHVYGILIAVKDKTEYKGRAQHSGFGRKLIDRANQITKEHGLSKIAVISGDGVKGYYRKLGFEDEGEYLTRALP